jgi:hypothetical protein
MGRYDFSSMVTLHLSKSTLKKVIMKYMANISKLLIFPALTLLLMSAVLVQDQAEELQIKIKYPLNILHHYSTTENTNVVRTFSDNTTRTYSRDIIYFFTTKLLSLPNNEFMELDVKIDSMKYRFIENGKEITANTEDEDFGESVYTEDLSNTVIPNTKTFIMVFSPYGDLAKITSDAVEKLRNYVIKHSESSTDSLKRYNWLNQLSDYHLRYIADIKKLLVPINPIKKDSVWKSPIVVRLDGKTLVDTADVWIAHIELGEYFIEGVGNKPKFIDNYGTFYGIRYPMKIDSTLGKTKYSFRVDPYGTINETEGMYSAKVFARSNREVFNDSITVKTTTQLLGRYNY